MTAVGNISSVVGVTADTQVSGVNLKPTPNLPTPGQTHNTGHPEVDGVQVDLSEAAKEALKAQLALDSQDNSPHAENNTSADISQKIATAKRLVQGQVGIGAVSDIVDGFGNIDTAKLAELQALQAEVLKS